MRRSELFQVVIAISLLVLFLGGSSTPSVTPIPEGTPVSNGTNTITVSSQIDQAPTWSKAAEPGKIYQVVCVSSMTSVDGSMELKDTDDNVYSPEPLPLRYEKDGKQVLCRWFYVPLAAKGFTFRFADFPPISLTR